MFRKLFRFYVFDTISLFIVSNIASGLFFENEIEGLLITGVGLALASYFVKPIINLFLLPLNIATLGFFKFISHAITLYIVDLALTQFTVTGFSFAGFSMGIVDIPPIVLSEPIFAYLGFSVLISILTSIMKWVSK